MVYFLEELDEIGILDVYFWKLYKTDKVSYTKDQVGETLGLIPGRFFLLTYLVWLLYLLNRHYIQWIPFLRGKYY